MLVVSDTSPIRALHFLDELELLRDLFGDVVIPPAVQRELTQPRDRFQSIDISPWGFIRVVKPSDSSAINRYMPPLHIREAEALVLAKELNAGLVLIDERTGRKCVEDEGLAVIGTLGVLLRAKKRRLLGNLRPLLDRLDDELGFFMSAELKSHVLQLAGESRP